MRWEVSGRINAVLWGAASKIYSEQYAVFLYSPRLTFSPNILLKSNWCNYAVVLTQAQLGRIPLLFYQISINEINRVNELNVIQILALPIVRSSLSPASQGKLLRKRWKNRWLNLFQSRGQIFQLQSKLCFVTNSFFASSFMSSFLKLYF